MMKDVLIHQALHGYSEGHRLLESSIKLPDDLARLMLRMSDLSGGSIFPGFEEYLTGYPLAPANLYVFAKTWYAGEMPRPGCVWTHSLILDSQGLDSIPSLEQLNKLFIRPEPKNSTSKTPDVLGTYASSLRIAPEKWNAQTSLSEAPISAHLSALVNALYSLKYRNLLVASPSSSTFETAIMRLWSQQWPALRSGLSFCTGALSSRGFAGKPFDVQCAPPQLIREIVTSALAKQSQEMTLLNRDEVTPNERWFISAVSDALLPYGGEFRKLLWTLADGSRIEDFKTFASLVAELLSDQLLPLPNLIATVSGLFPDKSSGLALKTSLFGECRSDVSCRNFREWEILSELSTSEAYGAFDSVGLSARARASDLCKKSPDDTKLLASRLLRGPINPLGEDVFAGLLQGIDLDVAKKITADQPQFLPTLFRAKPELGISTDLWHAAGDHVRELFEAIASNQGLSGDLVAAITEAFLYAGADGLATRALEKWGPPAVFGILNYVSKSGKILSERAMAALPYHYESIMLWLSGERSLFAKIVCAHIVAPYSSQISRFGTDIWLRTYEELRQQSNYREMNFFSALLLALALQNTPPVPVQTIALCFQHIHQLTWDDKMPDAIWVILDPIVPHLLWIHDWDKCERLRRGLAQAFVKFLWPREMLRDCAGSDELFRRVLQSAKSVSGGYNYFHYHA